MFVATFDMKQIKRTVLPLMLGSCSVQELFDAVYSITALPMICFDTSFRHIAHCYEEPFNFSSWIDITNNSVASEENILVYRYLDAQEAIYSAGKATYINTGRSAEHPSINGAVIIDGQLAAYCGVMVENHPVKELYELVDLLCSLAAVILRDKDPANMGQSLYSSALLDDSPGDDVLRQLRSQLPAPYFFATLMPTGHGMPAMQYARRYIQSQWNKSISCAAGRSVYILFSDIPSDEMVERLRNSMEAFCLKYSFRFAASYSFFNLVEIPMRRQQAMLAMTVGQITQPDRMVYFFRYLYLDTIGYFAIQKLPENVYILPELRKLLENSGRHRHEYLVTLYCFLASLGRLTLTAKRLGLNKNTLIYKMNKIQGIMGLDLSDKRFCDRLLMSLSAYAVGSHEDISWEGT